MVIFIANQIMCWVKLKRELKLKCVTFIKAIFFVIRLIIIHSLVAISYNNGMKIKDKVEQRRVRETETDAWIMIQSSGFIFDSLIARNRYQKDIFLVLQLILSLLK